MHWRPEGGCLPKLDYAKVFFVIPVSENMFSRFLSKEIPQPLCNDESSCKHLLEVDSKSTKHTLFPTLNFPNLFF